MRLMINNGCDFCILDWKRSVRGMLDMRRGGYGWARGCRVVYFWDKIGERNGVKCKFRGEF